MTALGKLAGSVVAEHGRVVVAVHGEIDIATAPQFRALMDAALAFGGPQVTVDMAGVEFMDAQALTVLGRVAKRLSIGGGRLVVQAPSAHTYRVFQLTRLVGLLGVEPPMSTTALGPGLETLAIGPHARDLLDASLELVVSVAADVINGADGVSITLPSSSGFATVAASNDVVLGMDHDQYATGQGPCLDAARNGERYVTALLSDEPRWPDFVPKARVRGIQSILSTPLLAPDRTLGALNVYSSHPEGIADPELEWADRFAQAAATLLQRAESTQGEMALMADLQGRLVTRDVIAVARGILMQRLGVTQEEAQATLIRASRSTSLPLATVCAEVVESSRPPPPDAGA
jgi:anti-anti-sigma factor